ncbi:beta-lactamase family protein [Nocardia sp. 2]|uniref:Beta-lactamase family protein n=1 Tax=Nocardia acididurans TaxID=2802282 RepID=A0ABS1M0V2_9NOCA|nr:serine hydrolase domain-containing protein [Nocardia acididurans]MBL1073819.1 beta-lactamase family protein [Nocardia acididurans]
MSIVASVPVGEIPCGPAEIDLPVGVSGFATAQFAPVVRVFERIFAGRTGHGGALTVYRHGERVVDLWGGSADAAATPWAEHTGTIVFSATKGMAATVIHRLADRGLLDYDVPVAEYWPEFGRAGKGSITIAEVLTHRAGLSSVGAVAGSLEEMLDHRLMEQRLAAATPDRSLGRPMYHGLTQGWLLSGLARAVTGQGMAELFREEIAKPLGTDGISLGRPPAGSRVTVAETVGDAHALARYPAVRTLAGIVTRPSRLAIAVLRSVYLPGIETTFSGADRAFLDSEIPAGNGVATARGLATMYAPLAGDGVAAGQRYLSRSTVRMIRRIETWRPDAATLMLWHLGYHSMPQPGALRGFGHLGHGGSGGWADPGSGLAVGFVHNRISTPLLAADMTLLMRRLLPAVVSANRRV